MFTLAHCIDELLFQDSVLILMHSFLLFNCVLVSDVVRKTVKHNTQYTDGKLAGITGKQCGKFTRSC
jgi:hypothetical protein